ncbi:MAG: ECF transporter S component [Clostridia bacterium]|nr:ECF transporter S component [Clostridia bacterium]
MGEFIVKSKRLILSAVFLSLGIVLPFLTGQIKEIGDTLLPMHIPVMLCGLICGWKYGLAVGFLTPVLRGVIVGMPPLYPNAVWMAFELATYGFTIGFLYNRFHKIYISLIISMLSGRIVWGVVKAILLGVADKPFTIEAFIAGGITDAIPGIILQLVLIPIICFSIERKWNK